MAAMKLAVGQRATRSLKLTMDHVRSFAEITGDYNPLHFDGDFVSKTKFKRPVVQGGLTTGLMHALVAMDMPGPGTVFLSQNWKFTSPVYVGDTITAEAAVLSLHATKPVSHLSVTTSVKQARSCSRAKRGATRSSPTHSLSSLRVGRILLSA